MSFTFNFADLVKIEEPKETKEEKKKEASKPKEKKETKENKETKEKKESDEAHEEKTKKKSKADEDDEETETKEPYKPTPEEYTLKVFNLPLESDSFELRRVTMTIRNDDNEVDVIYYDPSIVNQIFGSNRVKRNRSSEEDLDVIIVKGKPFLKHEYLSRLINSKPQAKKPKKEDEEIIKTKKLISKILEEYADLTKFPNTQQEETNEKQTGKRKRANSSRSKQEVNMNPHLSEIDVFVMEMANPELIEVYLKAQLQAQQAKAKIYEELYMDFKSHNKRNKKASDQIKNPFNEEEV